MTIDHKLLLKEVGDYAGITLGLLLYTFGFTFFLLPNEIVTGGVSGIGAIIFYATRFPISYTYFLINALLLIVGLKILGWRFLVKTIYAIFMLSLMLGIAQEVIPQDANGNYVKILGEGQEFMSLVIGCMLTGTALAVVFLNNGSTGGTDIIAAIINKFRDVSLGRVIMICDVIIISSSYLVLRDWEKVIYGYVVLYVTAFCVDQVVESARRSVQFFIISEKYREIGERINREPHRGCTVIDAQGFYSGKDMKMLFVLAKRRQSNLIFRIINEVDPTAFVSQSAVIGVYGEGFDHFKIRMKKPETKHETD